MFKVLKCHYKYTDGANTVFKVCCMFSFESPLKVIQMKTHNIPLFYGRRVVSSSLKRFQWALYNFKVTNGFGTYIVQVDVSRGTRWSETSSMSILCEFEPRLPICTGSPKPSLLNNVNIEEPKTTVLHICCSNVFLGELWKMSPFFHWKSTISRMKTRNLQPVNKIISDWWASLIYSIA